MEKMKYKIFKKKEKKMNFDVLRATFYIVQIHFHIFNISDD